MKEESCIEEHVKNIMNDYLNSQIPRKCWTCKHFMFKAVDGVEQEGVGNRGCRNENIKVSGWWTDGDCLSWELQTDVRKRKPSFVSYYPKVT